MLKQLENILNTDDEIKQILSVKELIDNAYEEGTFFNLQLNTLELIRRFNQLYKEILIQGETNASGMNQLIIISEALEKELIFL